MTIQKLTPASIKKFSKTLKKRGIKRSALEVFFDSIINLIDPYEDNVPQSIDDIMEECVFDSIDDTNVFLHEYSNFINSAIGFINSFDDIEDDDIFEAEVVNPLMKAFYSADTGCYDILLKNIDIVLEKVMEVYEIDENLLVDEDSLKNILGENFVTVLSILVMISLLMHSGEIKKDDFETLQSNFIILCSFVYILDVIRQEKLEEIESNKSSVSRNEQENIIKVGRNDPCPCGSGKKYKKCCIHKEHEKKVNPLDELDLPIATHFPLSEKDINDFYTIWTRLMDFANKLYSDKHGLKYKKVYTKSEDNKYIFANWVMHDNYILKLRVFLLENFNRIIDEFIETTRLSKVKKETLQEWKTYRLRSDDFLVYEEVPFGALIWDIEDQKYYYVYDLYDSLYSLIEDGKLISMLLLPFKGRIIYDGLIGHSNVDFGQNMKDTFLKDYIKLRKTEAPTALLPLQSSTTKIYQLKISIKGAKPPIWRRVLVEDDLTYSSLHGVIQCIFDWEDSHLHEFIASSNRYTTPEHELENTENEHNYVISQDLKEPKDKIRYIYDFGDYWEHEIVLENILEKDEDVYYPKCIKGNGANIFEDIGGIWAYNDIVKAYKEGDQETLKSYYVDENFNPNDFSLDKINEFLQFS